MKTISMRWMLFGVDIGISFISCLLFAGGIQLIGSSSFHWLHIVSIGGVFTLIWIIAHLVFLSFWIIPPVRWCIQIAMFNELEHISPPPSPLLIREFHELAQVLHAKVEYCGELTRVSNEILERESQQKSRPQFKDDILGKAIQKILGTLDAIERVLKKIARGDLLINIPKDLRKTNLGKTIRAMVTGTRQSVVRIRKEVKHISMVSAKIAAMSQQGSRNAETETQAIESISFSIHQVAENLREVMQQIKLQIDSLDDTFSAIEKMLTSIDDINQGIEILSASAEATSQSISEIHDFTKKIEAHAQSSAQISEAVSNEAKEGLHAVGAVIEGIHTIKDTVENVGTAIQRLGNESERIGEILEVINDVAEQTNLLALNASIIAAQAGEHGRGFAVVAGEIKDLAERTRASTKEIAEIIRAVQTEAAQGMTEMSRCLQAVDKGVVLANQSGTVLEKIVQSIQTVKEMVSTMVEATVTQTENSQRVKEATKQVTKKLEELYTIVNDQTQESTQIADVTNFLKKITQQIDQSAITQLQETDTIVHSIEGIQNLVQRNAKIAHQLAAASDELGELESNLAGNIGQFLVTKHRLPPDFDPGRPTIAFVCPEAPYFFMDIYRGIQKISSEKHFQSVALEVRNDPVLQVEHINWLMQQYWLKGIVLAPVDEQTGERIVIDIMKHKIPLVVVDCPVKNASILVLSNNTQGGECAAEILRGELTEASTVLVCGPRHINSIFNRMDGFFKKATWYQWQVVEVFTPVLEIQEAKQSILEELLLNPDAEGIFLTNEDASLAYLELLQEGKLPERQIHGVSYDINTKIAESIADGRLLGTVFQDPAKIGCTAVQELMTLLQRPTESASSLKEVLVPVKKITKENLPSD